MSVSGCGGRSQPSPSCSTDLHRPSSARCLPAAPIGSSCAKGSISTSGAGSSCRWRLQLESALQHAIDRGQLRLVDQPQTDGKGRLKGAECLLRWTSPDLGEVSPGLFIPVAEATGMIHHIGAWVLEEACRQAVGWRRQGLDPPCLAVNVSSRQLLDPGRDLAERVREELDRSTLPARQLEIEFTESCLLPASGALETMARLAAMGVSLAVDDFGIGFSSLSVLHRFPIRRLKIDRSFISGIERRDS